MARRSAWPPGGAHNQLPRHRVKSTLEYRQLDTKMDWPFFDGSFLHHAADRAGVRPLTLKAAENFWDTHISARGAENHPMLLPADHWLCPSVTGPRWDAGFWNDKEPERAEEGEVANFLKQGLGIHEEDHVFFIAMRTRIYAVKLSCFLRIWPCFLAADDEAAFLFHPETGAFAVFGPDGSVKLGRKK